MRRTLAVVVLLGSVYLLSRREAALPAGDTSDLNLPVLGEATPVLIKRFRNGGLYRGLVGLLYDLGVRQFRVGHLSVATAYRQIMESR